MALNALSYVLALIAFIALDSVWLTTMGNTLYKPVLGDLLAENLRIAPAIAFYLMYPLAIVIFGTAPAFKTESAMTAVIYGALFGLFAYATYDLTNFATLRQWNWTITILDMLWGAFATGTAATLAYLGARALGGIMGISR
jgi:uncharacterized membrane protein